VEILLVLFLILALLAKSLEGGLDDRTYFLGYHFGEDGGVKGF
jgi:hypothetical protein